MMSSCNLVAPLHGRDGVVAGIKSMIYRDVAFEKMANDKTSPPGEKPKTTTHQKFFIRVTWPPKGEGKSSSKHHGFQG